MVNSFAGLMEEKDLKNELYTNLLSLSFFFFFSLPIIQLGRKAPKLCSTDRFF